MSEYWKSTPNYWCKFCKTFVRDTAVSRRQHEATGRHKGAVDRCLRTLQHETDRAQREKDDVMREIQRVSELAAVAAGTSTSTITPTSTRSKKKPIVNINSSNDNRNKTVDGGRSNSSMKTSMYGNNTINSSINFGNSTNHVTSGRISKTRSQISSDRDPTLYTPRRPQ